LLQGAQHRLPVGAGAHPKQAEMIDRQFQIEAGLVCAEWT
jgi:hypothetical protein